MGEGISEGVEEDHLFLEEDPDKFMTLVEALLRASFTDASRMLELGAEDRADFAEECMLILEEWL